MHVAEFTFLFSTLQTLTLSKKDDGLFIVPDQAAVVVVVVVLVQEASKAGPIREREHKLSQCLVHACKK